MHHCGYIFQLSYAEKTEVVENFDHLKYSSNSTKAFTEKGLYMLANDLQVSGTETSVELNLAVLKIKHNVQHKRPGSAE